MSEASLPEVDPTSRQVVLVLSGPNLNLLGERQPLIYGDTTLDELIEAMRVRAAAHDVQVQDLQSNHEGELIDAVHGARGRAAAVIINPGAFSHYAWGLHDALATFEGPVVELHLSNTARRESWRHTSVVTPVATGTIAGFGALGYELAIDAVVALLAASSQEQP